MRLMVWNIEKFTDAKFDAVTYKPGGQFSMAKRRMLDPQPRLDYMGRVVNAFGTAGSVPDVIAVIETMAGKVTPYGQPMASVDSFGVRKFLTMIKNRTGNNAWRVVPPIVCNPVKPPAHVGKWASREAVAVFYNTDAVIFEGPDHWDGAAIQRGAGAGAAYPAPWNVATLTDNTTRAGRVAHTDNDGNEVLFPNEMNRRPFMVDFREAILGPAVGRVFRCLFLHTSPQRGTTGTHVTGTAAVAEITDMNPLRNTTAAPNYYIACGDFNVNEYIADQVAVAYAPLTARSYKRILRITNTDSTHYRRLSEADPLTDPPFGYAHHEIIDNFFVRRNTQQQPNIGNYAPRTAINCVAGTPAPWATAMRQTLGTIQGLPTGPGLSGPTATFREWGNFWTIIATSDHLPIYLRIP